MGIGATDRAAAQVKEPAGSAHAASLPPGVGEGAGVGAGAGGGDDGGRGEGQGLTAAHWQALDATTDLGA